MMSARQDEAEDSRTSGVGRKRDFQELMVLDNTGVTSVEDLKQRSYKRAKQGLELLDHIKNADVMALDASSSAAVEPSSPSQNEPSPASQAVLPISWNKSVQGGLRISFGSKAQGKVKVAAPEFSDPVEEPESSGPVGSGDRVDDVRDVGMDAQQDHPNTAETSYPLPQGSGDDLTSSPSLGYEEAPDVSHPVDDSDFVIDSEPGTKPSNGTLQKILDEDEDKSVLAIDHGSAVGGEGLKRETQDVTKHNSGKIYPSSVAKAKQVYRWGPHTYQLPVLHKAGHQISLDDITFQDFVVHFIKTNPTKYHHLKVKDFRGAYNEYLAKYYKGDELKSATMVNLDVASEESVIAAIQEMKTLQQRYPRDISKFKKAARFYQGRDAKFELVEVLKDEKQVSVEDFTFQDFAPHFMRTNPHNYHILSPRMVVGAFKTYLTLYYGVQDTKAPERTLPIASKDRDRLVMQAMHDTERTLLTSEPLKDVVESSIVPLTTKKAIVDRDLERAALRNPNLAEARGFGLLPTQQYTPPQSGDVPPILFTPINTHRPSIPTHSETTSSITQTIPLATRLGQLGHDISIDQVVATKADSLPDLSESRAPSEESDIDTDVDIDKVEMDLQLKYFPPVNGKMIGPRCLACADIGHKTLDCPALLCSLCGDDGNHSDFTCPQNQRCAKCRQKGHSKENCPEKLLARNVEAGECDLCKSSEHLEVNCHYIWRSFTPETEEVRNVRGIPIHCYSCGSTGHYGTECGLHQGIILSGGITWSKSNLHKYLDENSKDRAVCSGVDYAITKDPAKVLNIKGKANDPITLEDSDDEVSFLHPRVDKAAAKPHQGQIRFGQNPRLPVNLSGNTSNHRNPQRHEAPAPEFGDPRRQQESARYGRERSFSPPPAYGNYDQAFPQDDHYRSQAPAPPFRQNNYRSLPGNMQGASQTYTFQPARNQPGGGNRGRTVNSRGGGGRGGGAAHAPPNESKQKNKKAKQKAPKAVRGGKAPR